ncbi:MAG: DUF4011 domain-containing protein [Bacteroidales bacterium]|nr:DUF4011 domain-containing protein [Bacteroidales bacterium]
MIELNLQYIKSVNYALINNGIDICESALLLSKENDIKDVCVECSGEYFQTTTTPIIPLLPEGKEVRLIGFSMKPSVKMTGALTEKVKTWFTIVAWSDANTPKQKKEIFRKDYEIELMPYDQWLGTSILPQSLASFVTPNHPLINKVVLSAAKILKEITGSSSLSEYQSGNTADVVKQIAAVYAALHSENIVYRSLPASFEVIGQRITLPEQVLSSKLGNCIELTILFASVLEAIGINSAVIIQKGHAYLAVWLVDDCCQYSVCDDVSYVEKKCSNGIGEMLVVESTKITDEKTSFEEAIKIANRNLADISLFEMMVDIRRCRLEGIRSMPQRIMNNGNWELQDVEGVEHDECVLDVKEPSRYDLSKVVGSERELSRLDIWERKLLDFSLRNNMLNLYLRQKAIQFISFDIDKLEDHLQDGEEYLITEKPNVDIRYNQEERLIRSKLYPTLKPLISNDIQHHYLHTYQTELETKNTLKNIYRAARNAIEETGANSLFLTIGTLRWFETERSETPRYAPILMLPVEMVYKKGQYYIRTNDEDIMLNVTLIEFLRQNYDIKISGLDPLPKDEHGIDVSLVFAIIRDAMKNQKRWDVEEESILGVFSFSKFLMWNDIHNHRKELMENKVIESLVQQRLTWQPEPLQTTLQEKDKVMKPEQLSLPVAVDSSQMAAVFAAGLGHSFILYGPPGTGKSQTITNLIANALFQGKRVLFVAEKMAALSVVQSRLAKIGLDPFCLEMHSNKATKRHILDQLGKALNVRHTISPSEYPHTAKSLFEERKKLIEYMEALHEYKGSDGFSLYDCIIRYEIDECRTMDADILTDTFMERFSKDEWSKYEHLLSTRLESVMSLVGQPSQNTLLGMSIEESDLASESKLRDSLNRSIQTISDALKSYELLLTASQKREELLKNNTPTIFNEDADELYTEWRKAKAKWFIPRFFAKRSFLNRLRSFNQYIVENEVDTLISSLAEYTKLHKQIADTQNTITKYFETTYDVDALPSKEELLDMSSRLTIWSKNLSGIRDWYQWCVYRKELRDAGLGVVVDYIEREKVNALEVLSVVRKTVFKALAQKKIAENAILRTFEGAIFDDTVSLYKKLTTEFQKLSELELCSRLADNVPHVTDNISSSSEIGLVNRNISNGGRGMSIRDLLDQIPELIKKLCPCMLMSPMSVARYLSLNQDKFDLVIFDEASQMPTSEAVGAIARGKALIVVGDPKQMPPTSFFSSTNVNEDEADIDDMESILEDCRTLQIPSLQLNWHYRSQHESLIAFSNNEYYEGSLITFPSIDDKQTKVQYVPVNGVYDKGGKRSNKAEADAIVNEVVRRLKLEDSEKHSIGIISFSVVQQNLIEDMLQERMDKDKSLREAADALYEPIFVKNLENVQGDERDVILFSIGYGPDKDGHVSMNFGPLNNNGGERRLNVAVSRARQEMMVFSSLKSAQIDLKRSKAKGVEGLKHFLEYAEQQILIQAENTLTVSDDSMIAKQIAQALKEKGYNASVSVGRSQFKVDVAIASKKNPEIYSLGVLLDGEGYHKTQTTRDREIVQPSVLSNLNWQVMRVWSVDWFNNPDRVIKRIIDRIEHAPVLEEKFIAKEFDASQQEDKAITTNAIGYEEYIPKKSEISQNAVIATRIIEKEQPITLMQLCRRVCSMRGEARVTPTMIRDFTEIANRSFYTCPDRKGITIWKDKESADSYVNYRPNSGRDVTDIPLVEITNVVIESVREQFSIDMDSLSLIAAKKLGFARRGTKVDEALNIAIDQAINKGIIQNSDGKLHL